MTFNNPVVGGETLIRSAIQSPDYVSGTKGWAIKADGTAEFTNIDTNGTAQGPNASYDDLTANQSFIYQGTELSTLLTPASQGVVAYGAFNTVGQSTTSTEVTLGKLTCNTQAGRAYTLQITNPQFYCSSRAFGNGAFFNLRDENNNVVYSWTRLDSGVGTNQGLSFLMEEVGLAAGAHTLTLTVKSNNTTTLNIVASAVKMILRDEGILPTNTGTAGTAATVSTYSLQVDCGQSISYTGSGAASAGSGTDNGSYMYFGEDPGYSPNGNWRSYAFWDQNKVTNVLKGSTITQFDIYVYTNWWYSTSGGTLYIGWHGNTNWASTTENLAGGQYQIGSAGFSGRGVGRWISLKNVTQVMNAIQAGTFAGIVLGPAPSTSYSYYGYAAGVDDTVNRMKIRATYTK